MTDTMSAVRDLVASLHVDRLPLRREVRLVRCERCPGTFCSSRDICPRCHGEAVPMPNLPMLEHLRQAKRRAEWVYRQAVARRRPSVVRANRRARG